MIGPVSLFTVIVFASAIIKQHCVVSDTERSGVSRMISSGCSNLEDAECHCNTRVMVGTSMEAAFSSRNGVRARRLVMALLHWIRAAVSPE